MSDFPSEPGNVRLRVGTAERRLATPRNETWRVREVFFAHCYGRIPAGALPPGPAVLDVGAHVGTFALYAKLVLGAGRLVCFEPYPPAVALLAANLAGLDAVVVRAGLAAAAGFAELRLHHDNSGRNSLRPDLVPAPAGRAEVLLEGAAAAWDELGPFDLLKLDAEGTEVEVLTALGPRLAALRVAMVEFHTMSDRREVEALLLPTHRPWEAAPADQRRGLLKFVRRDIP
jgi:FkbM family methyltransferase